MKNIFPYNITENYRLELYCTVTCEIYHTIIHQVDYAVAVSYQHAHTGDESNTHVMYTAGLHTDDECNL